MKLRGIVLAGLAVAGVCGLCFWWHPGGAAQEAVAETRRALRQQRFKTDLADFDFSTSDDVRRRVAPLTNAAFRRPASQPMDYARRPVLQVGTPELMTPVGPDAAIVVWRQQELASPSGPILWSALRESCDEEEAGLNAACDAALAGPVRFDLAARHGNRMLLLHLAGLRRFAHSLGVRVLVELRSGNPDAAWTNLLAATRLVTAYSPEPAEISHLARFAYAAIVFQATWQALQAEGWSDDRLARLQGEWESADFLRGLPETAAFSRACMVAACQQERSQPVSRPSLPLVEILKSPRNAWRTLAYYRQRVRYRRQGTYEDENALLLHYRDRELELRRAVQAPDWAQMRRLPGVTNRMVFRSAHSSLMQSMLSARQMALNLSGRGPGLAGRAAEAEARRRLLIAAIALARHHARHGSYPPSLEQLEPGLLDQPPLDFMDGRPLRYRVAADGHFVLYSVGLDCVDDGGVLPRPARGGVPYQAGSLGLGALQGTDLIWPRPASTTEVERFRQEQLEAGRARADRQAEAEAQDQWRRTAGRQAGLEKLLAARPRHRSTGPTGRDRSLSEALRNDRTAGGGGLDQLLTLRQIVTGAEPENVTFEVPINYDALTNLGTLRLYIDPIPDEDSDEGCDVASLECTRAAGGNCRLVWNTIYEAPGPHALQLGLLLEEPGDSEEGICGPLAPFVVSNLCQFSSSSAFFDPAFGATLRARLPESNATYAVELSLPGGKPLRTIAGSTSNGVIKVYWDLTDDHGRRCTNASFNSVWRIALPGSGRSQTLKGP